MNTKNRTFKKELSYYQNKYLIDMLNNVKPINEPVKKKKEPLFIRVIENICFALYSLVFVSGLAIIINLLIDLL